MGGTVAASARRGLRTAGLDTGRFGGWLAAQRALVHTAIVVLAVVVLVFAPLTAGVVTAVLAVAVAARLAVALLQRRPKDPTGQDVDASPTAP